MTSWGGFSDDALHTVLDERDGLRVYAIFKTRREARVFYRDVRPVRIAPARKKVKK